MCVTVALGPLAAHDRKWSIMVLDLPLWIRSTWTGVSHSAAEASNARSAANPQKLQL